MNLSTDPRINDIFASYPDQVRMNMQFLRVLVIESTDEMDDITSLEETLKWGEPSFVSKIGSTVRINWKIITMSVK